MAFKPNGYASPITKLANEVIHMIYAYLTPGEAANLRLLSKKMAVIGLPYLVPTVHLDLEEDSFNKLRDIADHPIASNHVYELVYEVDRLESLSWEDWSRRIMGADYIDHTVSQCRGPPEPPGANASAAAMHAYSQELEIYLSMPVYRFPQEQIRQEWNQFKDAYIKQWNICHSPSLSEKLRDALIRLPKLRSVRTSSKNTMTRWMEGFTQRLGALWDENAIVLDLPGGAWDVGLWSTQNVLRVLGHHNVPITTLCLEGLNWQFLLQNKEDFMLTKGSFRHLTYLTIVFTGRVTERFDDISASVNRYDSDAFRRVEKRGRVVELLSAAPDLEVMAVSFFDHEGSAMSLEHTFGTFHWHSLKSIELIAFDTSENELLDFFSRHANSLQSISLNAIDLWDGTWLTTLHRMRQKLKLKHVHAHEELTEANGIVSWVMRDKAKYWDVQSKVFYLSCVGELIEKCLQEHDMEDMTFEAYLASLRVEGLALPRVLL